MLWPHASPKSPCPICGKTDWCSFGDKAILCQRVESIHPFAKGGWFHFYGDTEYRPTVFNLPKRKPPARINAESLMATFQRKIDSLCLAQLSNALGVSQSALRCLSIGYSADKKAWAFPMRNKDGKTCGIRLRNIEGFKWAVAGSSQGVFVPEIEPQLIAFLPEGPTDTAACLDLGFFAIGRPSCNTGIEELKGNLARLSVRKVVIVADNDSLKQIGNRESRPGYEGAMRLKKELGLTSIIWVPPGQIKDVREFLKLGGTKQLIENEIAKKVWTK